MPPRPYILAETNWKTVKETSYEVVILPWGATEAHNYHMPYGTDNFQCDYVAAESARVAWEKGAKVVVLPTIPFGVNTGQLDITLDINMMPSTQMAILKDVVDVLARQGIPKLVILNGHGGNNFQQMLRELQALYPTVFLCTIHWFRVIDGRNYFDDPGDHAGAMETSAMMHIAPDWVLDLSEAGDGSSKPFKIKGFQEGWAWAQREWSKVTADTGVGNPYESTPEKGKKYLDAVTEKIGGFLVELSAADAKNMYE
ncbi:creatininase family protein [Cytophagaceae bacterium DM2B3-1]|uniref:Creatininase family protein n=1 Tax=Xanthocytophaga flava TaxID=3048013 RepID=A0ABT7CE30_9BACT|nr:creatininase family protein [Xanthocytophaga flavus]MDJ1491983.1 creatininase family protein [Xanthocytophaga flavus]